MGHPCTGDVKITYLKLNWNLPGDNELSFSCMVALRWMLQDLIDDKSISIGLDNGLVPSGNKPLPEQVLAQIYVTIWCYPGCYSATVS